MKLLIDNHLLLWTAEGFEYLPSSAQTLMSVPENELFLAPLAFGKSLSNPT